VGIVRALLVVVLASALYGCGRFGFEANRVDADARVDDARADDSSGDDASVVGLDAMLDGSVTPSGWTVFAPSLGTTNTLTSAMGFAANDWWIGGVGPSVSHFDGTSWTSRPGPAKDVAMMWGKSPTDVWEVGTACDVNRWNGSTWTASPPTGCVSNTDNFIAIGGVSATDLWLVGGFGLVQHLVGTTWTSLPQGANIDLWSVWAPASNNVYMVGIKGAIRHWTGTMAIEDIATNQVFSTVWGSSANDVWVVGGSGLIYRKVNNGAWTQVTSPTTQFLYGLWGSAANDIWAVGDNATVIHYDGSQWSTVTVTGIDPATSLRWIAGVPGGGVIAVGTAGTVLTHP
jgi:trimeric autotransporter adhesin